MQFYNGAPYATEEDRYEIESFRLSQKERVYAWILLGIVILNIIYV